MNQTPNCPHCGSVSHRHSTSTTGKPRYRCSECSKTFSERTGRAVGRPSSVSPTPAAIKQRAYRERKGI